jgi:glutamate-1-semialdehyde 2,1-aminomutase
VELAEILCDVLPCAERVRLTSSGSEAVQAALRLARAATGRRRVLKFEGHYHGWIDSVYVSVTPSKLAAGGSTHGCSESRGQVVPEPDQITVLPWNDAEVVTEELAAGDVAAVIMEPVPANNGVILPRPGYLEAVRRECDRRGTMLVFDEIITGFRLALGGAQERLKVVPDLGIFGKAMASGFPIACVAGRESAFDGVAENDVVLAGTFNGNVASVRAALATVRTLRGQPDLYENAEAVGRTLMDGILACSRGELVIQGLPSMFWTGFGECEVLQARDLRRFDQQRTLELSGELARRGVHVTTRGVWYVSGLHSDEDARFAISAFAAALSGSS